MQYGKHLICINGQKKHSLGFKMYQTLITNQSAWLSKAAMRIEIDIQPFVLPETH